MNRTLDTETILDLQRTLGNQYVNRLLRASELMPVVSLPQEVAPVVPIPPLRRAWLVRLVRWILGLFKMKKRSAGGKPDGTTTH